MRRIAIIGGSSNGVEAPCHATIYTSNLLAAYASRAPPKSKVLARLIKFSLLCTGNTG